MTPGLPPAKVIIISKRLASLCATKALLNSYGFDVATVTTQRGAQAMVRGAQCLAAIVCYHSFTPAERDHIEATLSSCDPNLHVANCPGCAGSDEQARRIGTLPDNKWLHGVIVDLHS